jgi:hypothetical protein
VEKVYEFVEHDDWEIMATLDIDDPTTTTRTFKSIIDGYKKVRPIWGTSTGKVSAINRDLSFAGDFDILVLLSDDMWPMKGFGPEILRAYSSGFSGLAHFPDGVVNERLCTFTVMDRKYFDLFGWIYNPIYKSVYCDNEQHELAVLMGRYKYIPVQIVRHLHPVYGMASTDELYKRNEDPVLYGADYHTYIGQKENYFFYHKYMQKDGPLNLDPHHV